MSELAQAIQVTAGKLGIDPLDLATAISYETGGTFDPWQKGPTTKWGEHRGLIQWGEPQRQKYGVTEDMPVPAQVEAAGQYLVDAGVKPGMGLMDIYSAINAGRVGLYNRSDAAAGGAPGTVADKVNNQMGGHRKKAEAMLAAIQAQAAPQAAPQAIPQAIPQGVIAPQDAPQAGILAAQSPQPASQGVFQPSAPFEIPQMAPIKADPINIPLTLAQKQKRMTRARL